MPDIKDVFDVKKPKICLEMQMGCNKIERLVKTPGVGCVGCVCGGEWQGQK